MRALALALLLSCLAVSAQGAPLDLLRFFEGASVSRGETRTLLFWREAFTASFTGRREGDGTLVLDERFRFPEAQRLQRWRLREDAAGQIEGEVETEGADGRLAAPVPVRGTSIASGGVELDYAGPAPGGGGRLLGFRHKITPNGDGTLSNRVSVRLWGVLVARSHVVFAKTAEALEAHEPR